MYTCLLFLLPQIATSIVFLFRMSFSRVDRIVSGFSDPAKHFTQRLSSSTHIKHEQDTLVYTPVYTTSYILAKINLEYVCRCVVDIDIDLNIDAVYDIYFFTLHIIELQMFIWRKSLFIPKRQDAGNVKRLHVHLTVIGHYSFIHPSCFLGVRAHT